MAGVRNIKAIGSRKPIPIFTWIPPVFDAIFKIELYDGTTATDITDIIIEGEYTDGVTETIGSFNFKIDNSTSAYTSVVSPYDKIRIYMDYGTSADTLRFVGMIERVSKSESNLVLSGRGSAAKVISKNITYSATDTARSTILSEIISENFSGVITTNNLETDNTTLTVNYSEKPFWDVVEEICSIGSRYAYVDKDFDFNYFEIGTRLNTTEAVVHSANLIYTGDFAPDASSISNRVRVYGKETNELPLIYTSQDTTSQSTFEVKDLKINDTSITTPAQAKARADYELARAKDQIIVGSLTSLLLPTLLPGEQLRISDPLNGIEPSYYNVQKFTHKFSNDDPPMTEITIEKERTSVPRLLRKRIRFESEISKNPNPNNLNYSYVWGFNTDSGTHSGTQIVINPNTGEGVLQTTGGATGTWESDLLTLDSNISAVELRKSGEKDETVQLFISVDGGTTYNSVLSEDTEIVSGQDIKLKVVINSADTRVKSVCMLYNLQ